VSVDARVSDPILGATLPAGSKLIAKYLLPGETVVAALRRHWLALIVPLSAAGGGLFLAVLLDIALPRRAAGARDVVWLVWSAAVWYLGWEIVNWWSDRFVVTDKRLMLVHGLFRRDVDMMPLGKVTDMRYERTILGRMLGFGSFVMESAGQDQALSHVKFVTGPDELYQRICALVFTPNQLVLPADDGTGEPVAVGVPGWPGYGPSDPDPDQVKG
jgi:membrane protein YdbS with pleckstrin-like domain